MSRSYKDQPWKLRHPESRWDYGMERVPYQKWSQYGYWYTFWCYVQKPGVKTKKKRHYQEYHGMPTPMWWVREFMNQPQRTRGKEWERQIVKYSVEDLVDADVPSVGRKPHLYYW